MNNILVTWHTFPLLQCTSMGRFRVSRTKTKMVLIPKIRCIISTTISVGISVKGSYQITSISIDRTLLPTNGYLNSLISNRFMNLRLSSGYSSGTNTLDIRESFEEDTELIWFPDDVRRESSVLQGKHLQTKSEITQVLRYNPFSITAKLVGGMNSSFMGR